MDKFEDNSPRRLSKRSFPRKAGSPSSWDHRFTEGILSHSELSRLLELVATPAVSGTSATERRSCDMSSDLVNISPPDASTTEALSEAGEMLSNSGEA